MRRWQFDMLFVIAALGAVFLMVAPAIGVDISIQSNPTALTGYGAILTYVLTQRGQWTKPSNGNGNGKPRKKDGDEGDDQ